jgi:hypothetical protein
MRSIGLAAALAACGGRTDPGSGTNTLFVLIEVNGKPDSTSIEANIEARGNGVVGANVVFEDLDRRVMAVGEQRSAGSYRASIAGYARALSVRIVSADDELEAQLEGPAPHVITRPENDVIVDRKSFETLKIEWEADDRADRVEIIPQGAEKITLDGDPFEARIPLGGLENGSHDLEVIRENDVDLDGGTAGSRMRTRYTVDNRFTLEG